MPRWRRPGLWNSAPRDLWNLDAAADVSELAKFYYSLPPESQAAQRFIDGLPVPTVQQVLEFRANLEAAELGYEGPAPASPLGVQEHVVEVL